MGADLPADLAGGQWASDNQAVAVFLNGISQPLTATTQFGGFIPLQLDDADFVAGRNTLTFVVFNEEFGAGHTSPTGLRVEGSVLQTGSLTGSVYVDANNNGKVDRGEPGIPGVTVVLSGTDDLGDPVSATAVTGADGTYQFPQLRAGTYGMTELDPSGYVDARDTAGTAGGTAGHDTIGGIALGEGVEGVGYDLGWERAPTFTSSWVEEAEAGATYSYQAAATDADGDPRTYTLLEGPAGMTVGSADGLVSWDPGAGDVGTHPVVLQVGDGRGGYDRQAATLDVLAASVDAPPHFTSPPVLSARAKRTKGTETNKGDEQTKGTNKGDGDNFR